MTTEGMMMFLIFLMVSSAVLLVYTLVGTRKSRLDERLEDLDGMSRPEAHAIPSSQQTMGQLTRSTLPRMGAPLIPTDEKERTFLKSRLVHAGYYGRQAMPLFLGVKIVLMVSPALLGLATGTMGLLPLRHAVLGGACLGIFRMLSPSFWLDSRKAKRQSQFRRALPDALDVMVICLEGGLRLPGALKRVSAELATAHPILSAELNIVQREIQLGRSPGEALQQMGLRTDLEELRSLASVVTQAERFGASLVKSLRVHAETLRIKRQQQAEEMAQKAGTKILFPTLLFIFPAIFVVILGPAVFNIMEVFANMKHQ